MNTSPTIVIIGAGGHGRSVLDVAISSGKKVLAFIDEAKAGQEMLGVPIIAQVGDIMLPPDCKFFVAIGDNSLRQNTVEKTRREMLEHDAAILVHSSAYVSPLASLAPGAIVMSNAFVGSNCTIGEGCILNTGSQIDHDGVMGAYSSLGPKACLGGTVKLGVRAIVGIGATVKHGVQIGDDSLLAAHAYLHRPMPNGAIYMGAPAIFYENRKAGDVYL
ncbi:MAG: NeuD/PglB/VioB family sugar acetyltransferase [Alphaproteobacteria bacterium]|nr:NeuD/PglB/VioB family sugar acetyltransferase [Alphaproteobacteria bacterium]